MLLFQFQFQFSFNSTICGIVEMAGLVSNQLQFGVESAKWKVGGEIALLVAELTRTNTRTLCSVTHMRAISYTHTGPHTHTHSHRKTHTGRVMNWWLFSKIQRLSARSLHKSVVESPSSGNVLRVLELGPQILDSRKPSEIYVYLCNINWGIVEIGTSHNLARVGSSCSSIKIPY